MGLSVLSGSIVAPAVRQQERANMPRSLCHLRLASSRSDNSSLSILAAVRIFQNLPPMHRLSAIIASGFLLCHCSFPGAGRADGIDPNPFNLLENQAQPENRDPSRISVPVLRSAALEKRWGKPKLLVGPKGGYALRYENPANDSTHLTIFGSPTLFPTAGAIPPPYTDLGMDAQKQTFVPVEVAQKWQTVEFAGRSVRFCVAEGHSGDEPVQFTTETFRLTGPDGRTASYRLRAATVDDGTTIESLLRTAAF